MAQSGLITREQARFSSDSQLLSELGERLIASTQVALTELIKNAYDADATKCNIWLENENETLVVKDDGHGMTEREFSENWMTIATSNRSRNPESRRYGREVTGSKGVGRFAVRNLGLELELESVAKDPTEDEYRRLVAEFDWREFESGSGLREMEIEYRLYDDASSDDEGTTLQITDLREDWSQEKLKEASGEVLDIVSAPYEPEPSEVVSEDAEGDPGFSVYFAPPGEGSVAQSPAKEIYDRWTSLVEIELDGDTVLYRFKHQNNADKNREFTYTLNETYISHLNGEIRYFDMSQGQFRGMETLDGRSVPSWLKENGGVRVIDKGFRMPPYGDRENDWLNLSESQARREREWRSPITERLFPENELNISVPRAQLALPGKRNLLGAVNVSSYRGGDQEQPERLVPAMDRQGFIENEGFNQLQTIIRGAIEGLSIVNKQEQKRQRIERAERKRSELGEQTQSTIEDIERSTGIDPDDKEELVSEVREIEEVATESVQAEREAREAVESMNLLGAVTAFMSHESSNILDNAEELLRQWRSIPEKERSENLQETIDETERLVSDFRSHLGYAENFMERLSSQEESEINPKSQVRHVVNRFESRLSAYNIEIENEIEFDLSGPEMNVALYSGVLTNLLTNAIKAVSEESAPPEGNKIRFEAENTSDTHKLRVIDNGTGIPEEEEDRIFDPLYSTTDSGGPESVGAGLGLYIVKRVVDNVDGEIELVAAPEAYSTAFEVRYPL
ncbi:sensor histidine kinase [Haloglomus litoreum]|uniref:sensor histidine kinase n=1 Tax=Haloglomus litoreum TaxID=3034026 RepID=UPI0023E841FA|nr:sensor histidine kinase [Haloglomus sp. DT116]